MYTNGNSRRCQNFWNMDLFKNVRVARIMIIVMIDDIHDSPRFSRPSYDYILKRPDGS